MDALGDRTEAAGTVIDRVHRRDDGEEDLGGANVTRRFVAANVLLPRLHRKPVPGAAAGVMRHADQASSHVALVSIAGRKISRVRSAESEWNTEALRAADG